MDVHQRFLADPETFGDERAASMRAVLSERFSGLAGDMFLALDELGRISDLTERRKEIHQQDHRFLLGLLLNVPTRKKLLELVKARGEADPVKTVARWVRELVTVPVPHSAALLETVLELEEPIEGLELHDLLAE